MIGVLLIALGLAGLAYQAACVRYASRKLRQRAWGLPVAFPLISLLKPISGIEEGLEENLESFFRLEYPNFEILFCSERSDDPAFAIVQRLAARFPEVPIRLVREGVALGSNPKINAIGAAYREAAHDWLWITDANTRVEADFLKSLARGIEDGADLQSAVFRGVESSSLAGRIESLFYGGFFSKAMCLLDGMGNPCASAKCLFFRRSDLESAGGLAAIADYHADDARLGRLLWEKGKRVALLNRSISVRVGNPSWNAVWSRQVRWGRNRRVLLPLIFAFSSLFSPLTSCWLLAWGAALVGFPLPRTLFIVELALWFLSDLWVFHKTGTPIDGFTPTLWVMKEWYHVAVYFASAVGSSVEWRGKVYRLEKGGRMVSEVRYAGN